MSSYEDDESSNDMDMYVALDLGSPLEGLRASWPADRASPTDEEILDHLTQRAMANVEASAIDRASPSILDDVPEENAIINNPEPIVQSNEPSSSQSSDNNTYRTPVPRHLSMRVTENIHRLREARDTLSFVTRFDRIVQQAEDSIRTAQHRVRQNHRRESRLRDSVQAQSDQAESQSDSEATSHTEPDSPSDDVAQSESDAQTEAVSRTESVSREPDSSASEESNQSIPDTRVQASSDTSDEPPAKVRRVASPVKNNSPNKSDDGETCPICLDTWGNSGPHRLVALKCGHLFGAECVERWLKALTPNNRTCPTCKRRVSLKDIRFIYARKLIAADTSEIIRLQKQVEVLQAEKNRTEISLHSSKLAQRMLAEELETLRKTMRSQAARHLAEKKTVRFALEKNLEICKDGACRVMTYNCRTYELYVSQKSANYLFPGYGIRKVSCVDYTLGQFVHLHPKPIRDIRYSQPSDLLLSVGLDSTARIVERGIPNVTINAGFPLWSCSWDHHRTNQFYVGGVGGMIHLYDFRDSTTSLCTLSGTGDMSPVVSLHSTQHGLLSCQLNSCWLWVNKNGQWIPKAFPTSGSFMSMTYDNDTQRALISMRPKGAERSKLSVFSLLPTQMGTYIEEENVFNGSARTSLMSRATFCKTPGYTWVAAHSESDATLYLHGLEGSRTMSLPAAEPALDVCAVEINGHSLLAALSESRLRIYKAVHTTV